jgi:hypothetical protein
MVFSTSQIPWEKDIKTFLSVGHLEIAIKCIICDLKEGLGFG